MFARINQWAKTSPASVGWKNNSELEDQLYESTDTEEIGLIMSYLMAWSSLIDLGASSGASYAFSRTDDGTVYTAFGFPTAEAFTAFDAAREQNELFSEFVAARDKLLAFYGVKLTVLPVKELDVELADADLEALFNQ